MVRFIQNILLYGFKTGSKLRGPKLIKSFNTHIITIKIHESSLLSVFYIILIWDSLLIQMIIINFQSSGKFVFHQALMSTQDKITFNDVIFILSINN